MRRFHIEITHPDNTTHEYSVNEDGTNLAPSDYNLSAHDAQVDMNELKLHHDLTGAMFQIMKVAKHLEVTEVV